MKENGLYKSHFMVLPWVWLDGKGWSKWFSQKVWLAILGNNDGLNENDPDRLIGLALL